jgi:hypothetical protein
LNHLFSTHVDRRSQRREFPNNRGKKSLDVRK